MITWVKLKNERWLFKKGDATKELDNFKQLYLWSTFSGISDDDIIVAQMELNNNETHNYAEFGMKNRFTLTGRI